MGSEKRRATLGIQNRNPPQLIVSNDVYCRVDAALTGEVALRAIDDLDSHFLRYEWVKSVVCDMNLDNTPQTIAR